MQWHLFLVAFSRPLCHIFITPKGNPLHLKPPLSPPPAPAPLVYFCLCGFADSGWSQQWDHT